MLIPALLTQRFSDALQLCDFSGSVDNIDVYAEMIRPSGNPKFGDYQSNCAMPIGKLLPDSNPREVAAEILTKLKLDDLCGTPDIAGPGFINLKLTDAFLQQSLMGILDDERCGVAKSDSPKRILVDYSSPNVAKPMHVGHIRTTVIGNCLAKTLAFLGHEVTTDNHLGDWGTQFGMIIYGYKHFGDADVVSKNPVPELAKLYRTVHELISYHKAVDSLPRLTSDLQASRHAHEQAVGEIDGMNAFPDLKTGRQVCVH